MPLYFHPVKRLLLVLLFLKLNPPLPYMNICVGLSILRKRMSSLLVQLSLLLDLCYSGEVRASLWYVRMMKLKMCITIKFCKCLLEWLPDTPLVHVFEFLLH